MKLGRVIGQIVSTRKEGNVDGLPLLVVKYLDENLGDRPHSAACIDTVSAKNGDIVLLCMSSSARMTKYTRNVCTDNTIVGIVDIISIRGKDCYKRSKNNNLGIRER